MSSRIPLALALSALACASLEMPEVDEVELDSHVAAIRAEALELLHRRQARLLDIAYRLRLEGAPLCGDETGPMLGAVIVERNDYAVYAEEAKEVFDVTEDVRVIAVAADGPAEQAGIRPGDFILAVDDEPTPASRQVFKAVGESSSVSPGARIRRNGEEFNVSLPRIVGCKHVVRLHPRSGVDTIGMTTMFIQVPTGLLAFASGDDEVAIAVGHQIAHNVQHTSLRARAEDEPPADRLGLFIAARAGFDVSQAPDFWDRVAAEEPWKISFDSGHGDVRSRRHHVGMPARAPVIRSTIEDIRNRLAAGEPLTLP